MIQSLALSTKYSSSLIHIYILLPFSDGVCRHGLLYGHMYTEYYVMH